jgi:hypothetical protein
MVVNGVGSLESRARDDLEQGREQANAPGGDWLRWGCGCEGLEGVHPGLYLCGYHERLERDEG